MGTFLRSFTTGFAEAFRLTGRSSGRAPSPRRPLFAFTAPPIRLCTEVGAATYAATRRPPNSATRSLPLRVGRAEPCSKLIGSRAASGRNPLLEGGRPLELEPK